MTPSGRLEVVTKLSLNQSCHLLRRMTNIGKDLHFIKLDDGTHGYYGFSTKHAFDIADSYLQSYM